jgi:hypothetical protein
MSAPDFREERSGPAWLMIDTRLGVQHTLDALLSMPPTEEMLSDTPGAAPPGAGRASTGLLTLDGSPAPLHLRRALHGGLLAPLWRGGLAGVQRLRAELDVNAELLRRGAPGPVPALAIAERRGALWRAIVATLHQPESLDGLALLREHPSSARIERCALAAGQAARRFHDLGGRHADLNLGNLLLCEGDALCSATLIDLDKGRVGPPTDERRRLRELRRLDRSLHKHTGDSAVVASARVAFARGYREPASRLGPALLACLAACG